MVTIQNVLKGRTSHTCEELPCKTLYLTAWKGHKRVGLEEVEHALSEKIRDNTDMVSVVKAIP